MLNRASIVQPLNGLKASIVALSAVLALSYTTPAGAALVPGVDVYSGNGNITWSSVKNAGCEFAFVKATEGVNFIDTKFSANMTNANAAGLWTAPYHFAHPESKNGVAWGSTYNGLALSPNSATQLNRDAYADAVSEATDFLSSIRPYYLLKGNTKYMKPVLDLELSTIPDFNSTSLEKTFVLELGADLFGYDSRFARRPAVHVSEQVEREHVLDFHRRRRARFLDRAIQRHWHREPAGDQRHAHLQAVVVLAMERRQRFDRGEHADPRHLRGRRSRRVFRDGRTTGKLPPAVARACISCSDGRQRDHDDASRPTRVAV